MGDEYERLLYVIGNDDYGWYKIGISDNPDRRIGSIQTGCPVPIRIALVIETDQAAELERLLHRRYAGRCISREWFALTADDLDYIAEIGPGWSKETWEQGVLLDIEPGPIRLDGWRQFLGEWFCEKYPELV